MPRHLIAAAALAAALAAIPAAAPAAPAAAPTVCPAPAAALGPALPGGPDGVLETRIDQLTGIIAQLSDRLASLEDALGQDDGDGDGDDGLQLTRLTGPHAPGARPAAHHGAHARPAGHGRMGAKPATGAAARAA